MHNARWNLNTIANQINLASYNGLENMRAAVAPLLIKGNVVDKYHTLALVNVEKLPHETLAELITLDDEIRIFVTYGSNLKDLIILESWIIKNNAADCAYYYVTHNNNSTRNFNMISLAVKSAIKYKCPDMLRTLYTYVRNDPMTCLRVWSENKKIWSDRYWITSIDIDIIRTSLHAARIPHYYPVSCNDVLLIWRSLYHYRDVNAIEGIDGIEGIEGIQGMEDGVGCLNKVAILPTNTQMNALHMLRKYPEEYKYFCQLDLYKLLGWNQNPSWRLVLPWNKLSIELYQLCLDKFTISSRTYLCLMHAIYGNVENITPVIFYECLTAITAVPLGSCVTEDQYHCLIERLYDKWVNDPVAYECKPAYMECLPIMKYIERTLAVDSCQIDVLVRHILLRGTLDSIPKHLVHMFLDKVPQLITIREFSYDKPGTLRVLEDSKRVIHDDELAMAILEYLSYTDSSSSVSISEEQCKRFFINNPHARIKSIIPHQHIAYYHQYDRYALSMTDSDVEKTFIYGILTDGSKILNDIVDKYDILELSSKNLPSFILTQEAPPRLVNIYQRSGSLTNIIIHPSMSSWMLSSPWILEWASGNTGTMYDVNESAGLHGIQDDVFRVLVNNYIINVDTIDTSLLTTEQKDIIDETHQCSICLQRIPYDSRKTMQCKHMFHAECIDRWLHKAITCPICRQHVGVAFKA